MLGSDFVSLHKLPRRALRARHVLGFVALALRSLSVVSAGPTTVRCFNPALAQRLGMPISFATSHDDGGIVIREGQDLRLEVVDLTVSSKPFRIDFCSQEVQQRLSRASSELVVKAIGKTDRVIDLTAGLGRDSVMLAASGKIGQVLMLERNSLVFHLLDDAISRLRVCNPVVGGRVQGLLNADATQMKNATALLETLPIENRCIYLDPMYPIGAVGRKSLVKKETQILHHLVAGDEECEKTNNAALFATAKFLATNRIVVKRPINASPLDLGAVLPSYSVKGKAQRFDVYTIL